MFWDISPKAYSTLSNGSVLERTLQYGDMPEVKTVLELLGKPEVKKIFKQILKKKRQNLTPKTINFFKLYFEKHL